MKLELKKMQIECFQDMDANTIISSFGNWKKREIELAKENGYKVIIDKVNFHTLNNTHSVRVSMLITYHWELLRRNYRRKNYSLR